jgi:hypothetical protein
MCLSRIWFLLNNLSSPWCSRYCTTSSWPSLQATCKAVLPSWFGDEKLPPLNSGSGGIHDLWTHSSLFKNKSYLLPWKPPIRYLTFVCNSREVTSHHQIKMVEQLYITVVVNTCIIPLPDWLVGYWPQLLFVPVMILYWNICSEQHRSMESSYPDLWHVH